jgi:hypothetical protein
MPIGASREGLRFPQRRGFDYFFEGRFGKLFG